MAARRERRGGVARRRLNSRAPRGRLMMAPPTFLRCCCAPSCRRSCWRSRATRRRSRNGIFCTRVRGGRGCAGQSRRAARSSASHFASRVTSSTQLTSRSTAARRRAVRTPRRLAAPNRAEIGGRVGARRSRRAAPRLLSRPRPPRRQRLAPPAPPGRRRPPPAPAVGAATARSRAAPRARGDHPAQRDEPRLVCTSVPAKNGKAAAIGGGAPAEKEGGRRAEEIAAAVGRGIASCAAEGSALRLRLASDDWHWSERVEMRSEGQRWLAVGPADAYVLLWVRVEGDALRRVVTLRTSHRLVNTLDIPLVVELGEGAAAGGARAVRLPPRAARAAFSDSRATRRARTRCASAAPTAAYSAAAAGAAATARRGRGAAGDAALGEVRQLITVGGGALVLGAHGGGRRVDRTHLRAAAPPDQWRHRANRLPRRRSGGEAAAAAAVGEVGAGESVALLRRPRGGLLLSLRPAARVVRAAAASRCGGVAARRRVAARVAGAHGTRRRAAHQPGCTSNRAPPPTAPACAPRCSRRSRRATAARALLVQSSVAHAHTIALPAADAAGAGYALGSWGGANEQSRPKFLLRFAAQPPDDAAVEWCDGCRRPRSAARVATRRRRNRLAAAARDGAAHCRQPHWHLELRAALTLHNTSARPLRAVVCGLPFFHSLPAGGSAPVEVWGVDGARSR